MAKAIYHLWTCRSLWQLSIINLQSKFVFIKLQGQVWLRTQLWDKRCRGKPRNKISSKMKLTILKLVMILFEDDCIYIHAGSLDKCWINTKFAVAWKKRELYQITKSREAKLLLLISCLILNSCTYFIITSQSNTENQHTYIVYIYISHSWDT